MRSLANKDPHYAKKLRGEMMRASAADTAGTESKRGGLESSDEAEQRVCRR